MRCGHGHWPRPSASTPLLSQASHIRLARHSTSPCRQMPSAPAAGWVVSHRTQNTDAATRSPRPRPCGMRSPPSDPGPPRRLTASPCPCRTGVRRRRRRTAPGPPRGQRGSVHASPPRLSGGVDRGDRGGQVVGKRQSAVGLVHDADAGVRRNAVCGDVQQSVSFLEPFVRADAMAAWSGPTHSADRTGRIPSVEPKVPGLPVAQVEAGRSAGSLEHPTEPTPSASPSGTASSLSDPSPRATLRHREDGSAVSAGDRPARRKTPPVPVIRLFPDHFLTVPGAICARGVPGGRARSRSGFAASDLGRCIPPTLGDAQSFKTMTVTRMTPAIVSSRT
jgi:hypothetical protein